MLARRYRPAESRLLAPTGLTEESPEVQPIQGVPDPLITA
jgi:hypothetical protein